MTKGLYDFILEAIQGNLNDLKATKYYLDHQMTLPQQYRLEPDEDKVTATLQDINQQIYWYENAIESYQYLPRQFNLFGNITGSADGE